MNEYFQFSLRCKNLILGERIKKGTFRPCLSEYINSESKLIPLSFSTITNAFKHYLGFDKKIYAVGYLTSYKRDVFEFAPSDIALNTAKLPLQTEFFYDVEGVFYVKKNSDIQQENTIAELQSIYLGAMKSKGFGQCYLSFEKLLKPDKVLIGKLKVRLYEEVLKEFGISEVIVPEIGYLFKPNEKNWTEGRWIKSIFEGSIVENAPDILVDELKYLKEV